jgi:hypothetical protein
MSCKNIYGGEITMANEKDVTFDELLGKHILTGVDMEQVKGEYEDSQILRFVLDGRVLVAIEDPEDGYRSSLGSLKETKDVVKNTFPPCKVVGSKFPDGAYEENNILCLTDVITGKIVMEVGTENYNDYYPCFVGVFNPENMAVNNR